MSWLVQTKSLKEHDAPWVTRYTCDHESTARNHAADIEQMAWQEKHGPASVRLLET